LKLKEEYKASLDSLVSLYCKKATLLKSKTFMSFQGFSLELEDYDGIEYINFGREFNKYAGKSSLNMGWWSIFST